jgi:hypothetical protein
MLTRLLFLILTTACKLIAEPNRIEFGLGKAARQLIETILQ